MVRFIVIILLAPLVGCSLHDDPVDIVDQNGRSFRTAGDIDAFSQTAYPWLKKYCAECHSKGGEKNGNPFADANVETAYGALLGIPTNAVDFSNPDGSGIVRKLKKDHNCPEGSTCQKASLELSAAIGDWWGSSDLNPANGGSDRHKSRSGLLSDELTIPENIPPHDQSANIDAQDDFAEMVFSMDSAELVGVKIKIKIQIWDSGSYRILAPEVISNSSALHIRDVRIRINGVFDPAFSDFTNVNFVVPGFDGKIVTTGSMYLIQEQGPGIDRLQIELMSVKEQAVLQCKTLEKFVELVKPTLNSTCMNCHRSGGSGAAFFDMQSVIDDDKILCAEFLRGRRVRLFGEPTDSMMVRMGNSRASSQQAANILEWLELERDATLTPE